LLRKFFSDQEFVKKFQAAPAGKSWHQAYLGGLLEHTLNVVQICEFVCQLYPGANRDLLITGAILHDIGKIYEYKYPEIIDYTDEGRLIGHITIQDALVTERIGEIKNFPTDLKNQLRHALMSHHGEKEMGSPKRPKTLEAVILHFADNLDAQAAGFSQIIKRTKEKGKSWSEFIQLIDRFLYAGSDSEEKNNIGL
jgi:3'-5' exoribonuclease